jgi:putative flippase GtrA
MMNKLNLFLNILTSQRFRDKHQVKIRYLLVGFLNTLFGLAVFPVLYITLQSNNLHYLYVLILSQLVGTTFAYLMTKYFVFKTKGNYINEFLRYSTFHFIYFLLNLAILPFLVEVIHLTPMIAQGFFSIAVIISSYFWHSQITFVSK